ncbi:hypothetical protein ACWCYY_18390 [Kitasatospora sp. NPDC001664]
MLAEADRVYDECEDDPAGCDAALTRARSAGHVVAGYPVVIFEDGSWGLEGSTGYRQAASVPAVVDALTAECAAGMRPACSGMGV